MPKIKYGQIGVGHAHASKFERYQESDLYEVVGLVEPDPELKQKAIASGRYRNAKWMTNRKKPNQPI